MVVTAATAAAIHAVMVAAHRAIIHGAAIRAAIIPHKGIAHATTAMISVIVKSEAISFGKTKAHRYNARLFYRSCCHTTEPPEGWQSG